MKHQNWSDLVILLTERYGPLALGIDPVFDDIPNIFKKNNQNRWLDDYVDFLLSVAKGKVGFVKFQSAFFESYGSSGIASLARGFKRAKQAGFGVILDAKRGDIGSTATAYAQAYLTPASVHNSDLEVDCMTVNPFLGPETLEPFFRCAQLYGKGIFVLAKTSNPGADWLQSKKIEGKKVSDSIALLINRWAQKTKGNNGLSAIGAVVGITYPEDGKRLRKCMPDSIFLAPGFGPQGGLLSDLKAFERLDGRGVLVPISRAITKSKNNALNLDAYGNMIQKRISDFQTSLAHD